MAYCAAEHLAPLPPRLSTKCRCRMADLERAFRRLTVASSVLFASLLVDGILSSFETGRVQHYLLVPAAIGFGLPWLVFIVARWVTTGLRKE